MKKVILLLVSWALIIPIIFTANCAANPNDVRAELLVVGGLISDFLYTTETLDSGGEVLKSAQAKPTSGTLSISSEQPGLLYEEGPGYEGKNPMLFVVRGQTGDEYYLWFREKPNNLYAPSCQGLIDALGLAIEDAIEITKPEAILIVPEAGTVNDLIFDINCSTGKPINMRRRESSELEFDHSEHELDSNKTRFRGVDNYARYNDPNVELLKVEDLSDPLYPKYYFLTISEAKGYEIICTSGAIQMGLGFWDFNSAEILDSEDDIVKSAQVDQQPKLLCKEEPGYEEKKPILYVVRSESRDDYYLWFTEKINNLYSPGCRELIDALGVAIEDAIEITKPEAVLRIPESDTIDDHIFNINCYSGTSIGIPLDDIFMEGEIDGKKAFENYPECEGDLEPPTQEKYPNDPEANKWYNKGFKKAYVEAKGDYILKTFSCKQELIQKFIAEGREAFRNESPVCPDLPTIPKETIYKFPHEGLNNLYNEQFRFGFELEKEDFETTQKCLEGIDIVARDDATKIFQKTKEEIDLDIDSNCPVPIQTPEAPAKYSEKPAWNTRYQDTFNQEFEKLAISWKKANCMETAFQQGKTKGIEYYKANAADYNCSSPYTAPELDKKENPYRNIEELKQQYEDGFKSGFLEELKKFQEEGSTCLSEAFNKGEADGRKKFEAGNYACSDWPAVPQITSPFTDVNRKQKYTEGFRKGFEKAREAYVMGTTCNDYTIMAPMLGEPVSPYIFPIWGYYQPGQGTAPRLRESLYLELPSIDYWYPPYDVYPIFRCCEDSRENSVVDNVAILNCFEMPCAIQFCIRFYKNVERVKVYDDQDLIGDISEGCKKLNKNMRTGKYMIRFEAYNHRGKVNALTRYYWVNVQYIPWWSM